MGRFSGREALCGDIHAPVEPDQSFIARNILPTIEIIRAHTMH